MFQQKCRIVYHVTAPLSPNDLPILGRPPSERLDPPILGFLFQDQLIWVLIQSWLTGVWPASKCSPILQTGFCFDFHHADTITMFPLKVENDPDWNFSEKDPTEKEFLSPFGHSTFPILQIHVSSNLLNQKGSELCQVALTVGLAGWIQQTGFCSRTPFIPSCW